MTVKRAKGTRAILLAACAAIAVVPATAHAQSGDRIRYNIQARDLGTALTELARQSNREIYFSADLTRGRRAPNVTGELTVEQALGRLLANSGLRYRLGASGGIVVEPGSGEAEAGGAAADEAGADEGATAEILVVGNRPTLNLDIRRTEDDAQPYIVLDSEDIQRAGAPRLEDFLRQQLPAATTFDATSQRAEIRGNLSSIALRGLDASETLILIDGRRAGGVTAFGFSLQPDINSIPPSAVERIEVLPATASGIYGGGATGGVINIVLRQDYSGTQVRLTYGDTTRFDLARRQVDITSGFTFGRNTNLMVSASYQDSGTLEAGDRSFQVRGRNLILANNPSSIFGSFPPLGSTTNIRSTAGNLVLDNGTPLNSLFTHVPIGYDGVASDQGAALASVAGTYNLAIPDTAQNPGRRRSLLQSPTTYSVSATLRHQFAPWLNAYLSAGGSRSESEFLSNSNGTTVTLLATSPANPFLQPIRVRFPIVGNDRLIRSVLEGRRLVGGIIADLGRRWRLNLDYTLSTSMNSGQSSSGLQSLTTPVRSGAINIFRDLNEFPPDFAALELTPDVQSPTRFRQQVASARASGPVLRLPAGDITVTALLERRMDRVGDFRSISFFPGIITEFFAPSRGQQINSAYLEAIVPVVSRAMNWSFPRDIQLQLAGRVDRYRLEGANIITTENGFPDNVPATAEQRFTSFDPTIALRVELTDWLMVRGSFGTGFLPPDLGELVPGSPLQFSAAAAAASGITDPLRNGETLGDFILLSGGNPNLEPERSTSRSAGFRFMPRFLSGMRFSVDWTQIRKSNNITFLSIFDPVQRQALITLLPERVTRATPSPGDPFGVGQIVRIDSTTANLDRSRVTAFDLSFDYTHQLGPHGTLRLYARGTYLKANSFTVVAGGQVIENAGVRGNVRWRLNGGIGWENNGWTIQWMTRFFDRYFLNNSRTVEPNQGSATVRGQMYHDLFVSHRFQAGWLANTEVQLSINNVLDADPPIDAVSIPGAYYSPLGDPRGRAFSLTVVRSF